MCRIAARTGIAVKMAQNDLGSIIARFYQRTRQSLDKDDLREYPRSMAVNPYIREQRLSGAETKGLHYRR